jgi:hypothetical protein
MLTNAIHVARAETTVLVCNTGGEPIKFSVDFDHKKITVKGYSVSANITDQTIEFGWPGGAYNGDKQLMNPTTIDRITGSIEWRLCGKDGGRCAPAFRGTGTCRKGAQQF